MTYNLIFEEVKKITLEVGAFIRSERKNFNSDKIEYKGLNDLVSYVDKTAEQRIVAGLKDIIADAGFVTEEKTINKTGERFNWIIDPLDGTTNFIHGIPTYSISIALKENDELVLGVVYEINMDELFYTWKGEKSYLNGAIISVSKNRTLGESLLATGFPYYDFEKAEKYMKVFSELIQQTHGLRRLGSAAVDLAYVACGRFEGYFEYNLNPWDVAAGALIVKNAGGTITNFLGGEEFLDAREIVAGNGYSGAEMLKVIVKHF
ncbi:inositol monophosphatase family protein [Solitalea koreensis]|uniref:Inositol-1-monophosphatase n=1 Tax=Solitalea koreensis TaxID=543615 RepID=A0A521E1K1_9SPHI|nr:inositol monophosphatase family protein [Solitalea koreensis]SMO77808.1 myo-inositol-1(or 4)-monophosphatase [Solitalea koreensis]